MHSSRMHTTHSSSCQGGQGLHQAPLPGTMHSPDHAPPGTMHPLGPCTPWDHVPPGAMHPPGTMHPPGP